MLFISAYSAFWIANWKEYNTGVLLTNVGQMGVTEMELFCIGVFLMTGILGQDMWQASLIDILPSSFYSTIKSEIALKILKISFGTMIGYGISVMVLTLTNFEVLRTLWQTR